MAPRSSTSPIRRSRNICITLPGEPGEYEAGGAQMVRVCAGSTLPKADKSKFYLLRTFGNSAHEIWDVTDPAKPALLTRIAGLKGTHKSWWECDTGIAYLVSGAPGWRANRMTQVYDLSDPAHPVKIRDFGLPGQEPGTTGPVPTVLHGMISLGPQANRIYFGYGTNKGGIVQIVDRQKLLSGPKEPTPENSALPGGWPARSVAAHRRAYHVPARRGADRGIRAGQRGERAQHDHGGGRGAARTSAARKPRQMVWFLDATVEGKPMVVSNYTVPEASGHFCERGGRFGAHSSNESMAPVFYKKLAFVTWFNAGVRALDIRDPYAPREVGFFIPAITAATDKRCIKVDGKDRCKVAIQSNNVETDDRGYIYVVDRANTGLHILEVTGEARSIAGLP